MSGDQKDPRGASRESQSSKGAQTSSDFPSAEKWEFLEFDDVDGGAIKGNAEDVEEDRGRKKAETDRYVQDTGIRKGLAKWACVVVSAWLLAVFFFLCLQQFTGENGLSDAVLMMLLSTTTLNVLGISFIVLNGYFKSHRSSGTSVD